MGAQVGEAYVRIRPNMAGFKSETETGVRSSFSSLAKIAGLAFGGAAIGSLIKSSIESAGQTQASAHAIADTYGRAGDAVLRFSKGTAATLGSLENSTQGAAVQLGQLFSRAGIGNQQAAEMSIGWEKLGLAINRIRGGGTAQAAEVLSEITHAAAGTSTRGLTELGIAINSSSIAAQAALDGFIKAGQSASGLTAAQKQLVTYQLAIKQLPQLMDQARAHSHDFAAEQARLAVQWDNAKTTLGTALLPVVNRYVTELADWLTKMEKSGRLQHDFNVAAHDTSTVLAAVGSFLQHATADVEGFVHAIGGAKNALIAIGALLAVNRFHAFGSAVRGDAQGIEARIKARLATVKQNAAAEQAAQVSAAAGASTAAKKSSDDIAKAADKAKTSVVASTTAMSTAVKKSADESKTAVADAATANGAVYDKYAAKAAKTEAMVARANTPQRIDVSKIPSVIPGSLEKNRAALDAQIKKIQEQVRAGVEPPIAKITKFGPGITGTGGLLFGGGKPTKGDLEAVAEYDKKVHGATEEVKKSAAATAEAGGRISKAWGSATDKAKGKLDSLRSTVTKTAASTTSIGTQIEESSKKGTKSFGALDDAFNSFGSSVKQQSSGIKGAVGKAASGASSAWSSATAGMKVATFELAATIKTALISTAIGALIVAIGFAVTYVISHWDTVKRYTLALVHASVEAFKGMGNIIVGVYQYIYGKAFYYLLTPIKLFIDEAAKAAGWIPFIGGKISDAAKAVDSFYGSVHHFAEGGRQRILGGFSEITSGVQKAWADSLEQSANSTKTKQSATDLGKKTAKAATDAATQGITELAPAVQKRISDALQNAIQAAHKAIVSAVQQAKNNLDKIGQELANTISQIQSKIGGAAGAIAGSPQGKAFEKLKKLIESGAPAFEIQKAQAELAGQLQNVGKTQKQQVSGQLANLTAAFNKGEITYKQFESRLHKILHDDGITMAEALKAGGKAFADAFKAQVNALGQQARAIQAVPAKFRGIGGAGGAADIKIIQPLQVIKAEQQKVRIAVEKAAQAAQKQRAAILKAQQKELAIQQQEQAVGVKVRFKTPPGSVNISAGSRHHDSATLGQIRDHTKRAADALSRHRDNSGRIAQLQQEASRAAQRGDRAQAERLNSQISALKSERSVAASSTLTTGISSVKNAVQNGHVALLRGLREICTDIMQADKDIVAEVLALRSPMENLRRTELRIADQASQQRDRQLRATRETNTLLRKLDRAKGVPGFGKERPGTGGKHAGKASKVGVKV